MPTTYTATPDTLAGGDVLSVTNPIDGDALTAASNNAAVNTIANRVKGLNDLLATNRSRSKFYPVKLAETVNGSFVSTGLAHRTLNRLTDNAAVVVTVRFGIWDIPYRAIITQLQFVGLNNYVSPMNLTCYAAKVDSLASYVTIENGGSGQVCSAPASGGAIPVIPLTATSSAKTWSNASGSEYLVVEAQFTGVGSSSFEIYGLQVNYTIIGP